MHRNKLTIMCGIIGLALISPEVYSANARIVGSMPVTIEVHNKQLLKGNGQPNAAPTKKTKTIQLQKIELSESAAADVQRNITFNLANPTMEFGKKKKGQTVTVGMDNVPVLDQGVHGTCVTFATTAALDAYINNGSTATDRDYISQLCNLELGQTLENQDPDNYPSGWAGSFASIVLKQMSDYGIVTKSYQKANGCGGLTEYPVDSTDIGAPMSVADFNANHQMVMQSIPYSLIFDMNEISKGKVRDRTSALDSVRAALTNGHRVVIGTLLTPGVNGDSAGVNGYFNNTRDVWTLTKEVSTYLKQHWNQLAGHEMVIIGFDDNASVVDVKGTKHTGMLVLRNSWSSDAGENGDFYMSYDFFKSMVMELHEIGA